MSVEVIPPVFIYRCDCCGKRERLDRKAERPKYWATLAIFRDAYDFQGNAVADGSIKRLLCADCSDRVISAINNIEGAK